MAFDRESIDGLLRQNLTTWIFYEKIGY